MRATARSRTGGLSVLGPPLLLVIALVAGACGETPFAERLDPARTSWRVAAINDKPATFPFTLAFNKDGRDGIVTLGTPCGPLELLFEWDNADDSIAIDGSHLAPPCNEAAQATTADFVDALAAVTSWEVRDSNHVALDGPWRVELTRLP